MKRNTVMGLGVAAGLLGMSIAAPAAFAEPLEKDCNGVQRLVCSSDAGESYRVTLSTDPLDLIDAPAEGSLRWAIEQANAHAGLDEIVFAPGLDIKIEDMITMSDGVILRGEGDAQTRATIGSNDEHPYPVLQAYDITAPEAFLQVENLSFDGQGRDGGGLLVADGLHAFGMYDTSMRAFGEFALEVQPDDTPGPGHH